MNKRMVLFIALIFVAGCDGAHRPFSFALNDNRWVCFAANSGEEDKFLACCHVDDETKRPTCYDTKIK